MWLPSPGVDQRRETPVDGKKTCGSQAVPEEAGSRQCIRPAPQPGNRQVSRTVFYVLGNGSRAHGVSEDGNCVVGIMSRDGSMWAGIWTPELGTMTDIMNQLYAELLADGSQLLVVARAISSDGTTTVWLWRRPSGVTHSFVLRRTSGCQLEGDVDRNGSVDDADLLIVLFNFGAHC
ncbi:MAG: hypothetical protein C4337_10705 [Armatimonadota bacterium]